MKRPAPWIALLAGALLLYQSLGSVLVWQAHWRAVKRAAFHKLAEGVDSELLTVFTFTKAELEAVRVEPHEIRYQGHMYDIVREDASDGGDVNLICVADHAEDRLLSGLPYLVQQAHAQSDAATRNLLHTWAQTVYLSPASPCLWVCSLHLATLYPRGQVGCKPSTPAVPTPPPRGSLQL